jgi:recombination protein RecA
MATTKEIMQKLQKEHGANLARKGVTDYVDTIRIPTGIFALDLAMGGGFPHGKCSIVYGPESSNKTNLVLLALAEAQRMFPTQNVVFVDAEHALDMKWAMLVAGIDPDRFILVQPEYAEQAADLIESFQYATDVSMIALDSIAALATQNEIKNSVETAAVGGASLTVGRLYRKVTVAGSKMSNAGLQPPAFIAINQVRTKIGVMFGNPETMPGGNPPKFASAMTVRVYGKNIVDKKLSTAMPAYKEVNAVIQKWKVPIMAVNAVYTMQMIEANGHKPGFISDWNTVSAYMKELDYLSKGDKGGWVMNGQTYNTLDACRTELYGDAAALADMKATLIAEMLTQGAALEPTGELPVEEEA